MGTFGKSILIYLHSHACKDESRKVTITVFKHEQNYLIDPSYLGGEINSDGLKSG